MLQTQASSSFKTGLFPVEHTMGSPVPKQLFNSLQEKLLV
jgi:hypothetical protein